MIESKCILRNLFNPVLEAAESINTVDLVVVATPMWNYSVPYVLKQYIGAPRFQNFRKSSNEFYSHIILIVFIYLP